MFRIKNCRCPNNFAESPSILVTKYQAMSDRGGKSQTAEQREYKYKD